jgi:gamma-glutamyltranspeptidase/glutathione hydrolase
MQRLYLIVFIFIFFSCKTKQPVAQKHLTTSHAMIVSAHPLASDSGIKIIKQGGNAVDAMVTTNFVLSVTYPRAGNIGGGGFMIIRLPDGTGEALDYREMAPASAHKNMYLDSLGNVIPQLSTYGGLAVGVPGTVAGLYAAWKKYGKIKEWDKLLEPAIHIARKGFAISEAEAARLNKYQADFIKYNPDNKVFIKEKWKAGDILKQPELAQTLQLIADKGPEGFYQGAVAKAIVEKIQASGGKMQLKDLQNYHAKFREPIIIPYKNYTVISMPPPSSGGVALGQLLKITEKYPIKNWGFHSYKAVHLITEAEKRVYADRAKYLGDADFYPVPVDSLLNDEYLISKMKNVSMDTATPSDSIMAGGFKLQKESFETTHISIVDDNGMAASCTTTLNSNYGSKVIVDQYGFFLNNEMDDFSAKPGVPNQFGLIGAEANSIAPHKRMLSSMTPTIVEKNGKIFMVLGTPGGSTIITSVFQTILNVIEYDMNMYEAVQAPRFHHQFLPDVIMYEEQAFSKQVTDSLQQSGQALKKVKKLGYVKAILIQNKQLEGSGDERNPDDDVSGY